MKRKNRHGARRVVSTGLAACGWLRGTSRTSPGPPRRWRRPVRLQGTSARGRGSAAYLPGCARQLFIVRCAHYARGASLSTFGFVTIVPRYLLPQVIPSHSFAALTALVVRRVNGIAALCMRRVNDIENQPRLASTSRRATPKGVERAPGSGTLPPARPEGRRARTRQRHLAALFFNIMTKKGRKVNCHRYQKHDIRYQFSDIS